MARPTNQDFKNQIKIAREAGASIAELCTQFGISRNTVFFHLKSFAPTKDLRSKYTEQQKEYLAGLTTEQLREVAARSGRSFVALQRVAGREKQKIKADLQAKIEVLGYLDFGKSNELRLYGFDSSSVIRVNHELKRLGLKLENPNQLSHVSGKYQALSLDDQRGLLQDPIGFLKTEAARLKTMWRER